MYKQFLELPTISTAYVCDKHTVKNSRIYTAKIFLTNKEYDVPFNGSLGHFDLVENILAQKVITYAIAFAGGATNGGTLYHEAVRDLLTWRAIFEGCRFESGWLV